MLLAGPGMNRVFELLAFVVALYFPVALLTWLVIDKFFATEEAEGHSPSRSRVSEHSKHVLARRHRPSA